MDSCQGQEKCCAKNLEVKMSKRVVLRSTVIVSLLDASGNMVLLQYKIRQLLNMSICCRAFQSHTCGSWLEVMLDTCVSHIKLNNVFQECLVALIVHIMIGKIVPMHVNVNLHKVIMVWQLLY
uniref:Uncharacterized protein n=1 Tax=Lactuca sativa TaxID=4236 RepID=A0A9R1VRN5_LACSA|nr:hypothetical protein LSAT_V11C400196550 [Lactuca sativa]